MNKGAVISALLGLAIATTGLWGTCYVIHISPDWVIIPALVTGGSVTLFGMCLISVSTEDL